MLPCPSLPLPHLEPRLLVLGQLLHDYFQLGRTSYLGCYLPESSVSAGHPQAFLPSSPGLSKQPFLKSDTLQTHVARCVGQFGQGGPWQIFWVLLNFMMVWAVYPDSFRPMVVPARGPSPFRAACTFGFFTLI